MTQPAEMIHTICPALMLLNASVVFHKQVEDRNCRYQQQMDGFAPFAGVIQVIK